MARSPWYRRPFWTQGLPRGSGQPQKAVLSRARWGPAQSHTAGQWGGCTSHQALCPGRVLSNMELGCSTWQGRGTAPRRAHGDSREHSASLHLAVLLFHTLRGSADPGRTQTYCQAPSRKVFPKFTLTSSGGRTGMGGRHTSLTPWLTRSSITLGNLATFHAVGAAH